MKQVECEFEADVLSAVMQSRWPGQVDEQLRAHVAVCEICSDVAAVAGVIDADHEALKAAAVVPDSARVWWRSQLRARREATAAAGRPITAAQIVAFACAIGLLGACIGALSTTFQAALAGLGSVLANFNLTAATAFLADHALLVLGAAALFLLVPSAVYFAMSKD